MGITINRKGESVYDLYHLVRMKGKRAVKVYLTSVPVDNPLNLINPILRRELITRAAEFAHRRRWKHIVVSYTTTGKYVVDNNVLPFKCFVLDI